MKTIENVVKTWNKGYALELNKAYPGNNFQFVANYTIKSFSNNSDSNSYYKLKFENDILTIRFCTERIKCNYRNGCRCFSSKEICKEHCEDYKICLKCTKCTNPKQKYFQDLVENGSQKYKLRDMNLNPNLEERIVSFMKKQGQNSSWGYWPIHKKSPIVNFFMYINPNDSIDNIVEEIKEFIDATYEPFSKELGT